MSNKEFRALQEKGIKEGDIVRTSYRGGVRQGRVTRIAKTIEEHPHPPKVFFEREREGQEPKEVAHNPSTLEKVESGKGGEAAHAQSAPTGSRRTRGKAKKLAEHEEEEEEE